MRREIERKFLVADDAWRGGVAEAVRIRQGYLPGSPRCGVRIRLAGAGATLCIKGPRVDTACDEFEYAIPPEDARRMLAQFCGDATIEKTRHIVPVGDDRWEVDVFHGRHSGLVLAELELDAVGRPVKPPPWVGREVTGRREYTNAYLATHPLTVSSSA